MQQRMHIDMSNKFKRPELEQQSFEANRDYAIISAAFAFYIATHFSVHACVAEAALLGWMSTSAVGHWILTVTQRIRWKTMGKY